MNRRQFLAGAAGAGATAAVGSRTVPRYSPVGRASAVLPLAPIGVVAGGAAIGYFMGKGITKYLGDERDYSDYTGKNALHQELAVGMTEMKSADERVMTSIENNLANSQNVALAKGKAAIIEKMNAEASESEATTAMQNAIDEYFATIQRNLINHWNAQYSQVVHHITQWTSHADVDTSVQMSEWEYYDRADLSQWRQLKWQDTNKYAHQEAKAILTYDASTHGTKHENVTLLNGETATVDQMYADNSGVFFGIESPDTYGAQEFFRFRFYDPDDNSIKYIDCQRFNDVWTGITQERDSVNSALTGFVSDVYSQYSPGDIPTEDLVDPITAATELSQNYDGMQAQGAHAAMLGIPTDANFSVQMTLVEDSKTVWADIYTNHVPTDGSGNEVGFKSGQTYSPSSWSEPLYIAYEYETSDGGGTNNTSDGSDTQIVSDFTQIEQDFTIDFIEDKDGNEVTEFQTTSRNNQTSDVSKLQEQLDQLREAQIAMQEEAQESVGGGGGFFDGVGTGGAAALAVGVLVALGLLNQ